MVACLRLAIVLLVLVVLFDSTIEAKKKKKSKKKSDSNSLRAGDEEFHKFRKRHYKRVKAGSSYTTVPLLVEEDKQYWKQLGQDELMKQLQLQPIMKKAKNVIMFLGDGMSIATVTAARILKGQRTGQWEHEELVFEDFPYTALLKTYTTDSQVADSAASATAYLCGVKANLGTIGLDNHVEKENCTGQSNGDYHATSILRWFQDAGRSSGFVTNMRVTHATPAGAYAHIADREWEDDHEILGDGLDSNDCDDIAEQLINGKTGSNLKVIMGGGRRNLQPRESRDVEEGRKGYRRDGKDLIKEWEEDKIRRGLKHNYIWNKEELLKADLSNTEYLMGLFAWSHMDYFLDREYQKDPSLEEMTRAAITVLQKDKEGFFLLVEGGLIDHGHHGNKARKALTETLEMDRAVAAALEMTDTRDTLIVVTSDHAHSMTMNGYPGRHTDILGFGDLSNIDYLPYHTLLYGNGPGYRSTGNRGRINPSGDDTHGRNYRQPAAVPESSSAHSGDDVGVWAIGPNAHIFTGTHDQVYVAHAMAYAACVGDGLTFCGKKHQKHSVRNKSNFNRDSSRISQLNRVPEQTRNINNIDSTQSTPNAVGFSNQNFQNTGNQFSFANQTSTLNSGTLNSQARTRNQGNISAGNQGRAQIQRNAHLARLQALANQNAGNQARLQALANQNAGNQASSQITQNTANQARILALANPNTSNQARTQAITNPNASNQARAQALATQSSSNQARTQAVGNINQAQSQTQGITNTANLGRSLSSRTVNSGTKARTGLTESDNQQSVPAIANKNNFRKSNPAVVRSRGRNRWSNRGRWRSRKVV